MRKNTIILLHGDKIRTPIRVLLNRPAAKAARAVHEYFNGRPEISRYLGVSFVTREARQRYFQHIVERWKGDEQRMQRIIERTLVGRTLRLNFWRYMLVIYAFLFELSQYQASHSLVAIAYGVSFMYLFIWLFFTV